jgi:hypothetical protein
LIFLLSDFLTADPAQLAQIFAVLRYQHDVISIMVSDPRETDLPAGSGRMVTRDLETGQIAAYRFSRWNQRRMVRTAQARQQQLQALWQRLGMAHVTVTAASNYHEDLTQMFLMSRGRVRR